MYVGGYYWAIEDFALTLYNIFFDCMSNIVEVSVCCGEDLVWVFVKLDGEDYSLPVDTVVWDQLVDWVDIQEFTSEVDWWALVLNTLVDC